jgi:hypothetical protein
MGKYLERLRDEFDTITQGINTLIDRAADENRDVSPDEARQVERDEGRLTELGTAIERYASIEDTTAAVANIARSTPPRQTTTGPPSPEVYDIAREFPSAGDYAATLHRAWVKKDPEAIEKIDRATAHQKTTDNPGLIPRPVVGPLLNSLSGARPCINSFGVRPAPAPKFDRPRIDQHVAVAIQAVEKDPTASREMKIGAVPVSLQTWAGHLNISKQDIRWTQPSILQVVFDDFTRIYGRETEHAVCIEFPTLVPNTAPLADFTPAAVDAFLRSALGTVMQDADDALINTVWMSLDVWAGLGGATYPQGGKAFNLPLGMGGDVLGLNAVVDPHFEDGTLIVGDSAHGEVWEDLEGFLSVDEPSVLGQLVGYAGYLDFVLLNPLAFLKAEIGGAARSGTATPATPAK